MSLGLVLSGGGARAAYQAGALAAIAEICTEAGVLHPFDCYSGLSAGAINATVLCSHSSGNFPDAAQHLKELWSKIEAPQVYQSGALPLSMGGLKWLAGLSLGGLRENSITQRSLLNTEPLRELLVKNCEFENIRRHISNNHFKSLAISALDYQTSSTVTFIEGAEGIPMWQRVRHLSEKTEISADHVMASSSIPILFPPVQVGSRYFGDGCVHNTSPCAPAIYLGVSRLIAIGVRKKQDLCFQPPQLAPPRVPSVGRIANVLLHAVMMDGMELDVERMERINENMAKLSKRVMEQMTVRPIKYLWLAPSREISEVASRRSRALPAMIRYLLKGLGTLPDVSEISSYLLFDPTYCNELIELGYEDARKERQRIQEILEP